MIQFVAAAGAAATCLLLATSAQPVAAPDVALAVDAVRGLDRRSGAGLRQGLPHLGVGIRRHHRRYAARLRCLRQEEQDRWRDHRARFRRRLGARRARARPLDPQARHDHDGRPHHRSQRGGRRQEAGKAAAQGLLRIDVRLRAARRHRAPRAGRGARDGAPDLARRPPRRSDRRQLFGGRSRRGPARYRPARPLHRGDGRRRRSSRDRAQDSAVGADAPAVARGTPHHEGRDHRGRCARGELGNGDALRRWPAARGLRSTPTAGRWWRSTAARRSAAAIRSPWRATTSAPSIWRSPAASRDAITSSPTSSSGAATTALRRRRR